MFIALNKVFIKKNLITILVLSKLKNFRLNIAIYVESFEEDTTIQKSL